jgi:hypothetical protein
MISIGNTTIVHREANSKSLARRVVCGQNKPIDYTQGFDFVCHLDSILTKIFFRPCENRTRYDIVGGGNRFRSTEQNTKVELSSPRSE